MLSSTCDTGRDHGMARASQLRRPHHLLGAGETYNDPLSAIDATMPYNKHGQKFVDYTLAVSSLGAALKRPELNHLDRTSEVWSISMPTALQIVSPKTYIAKAGRQQTCCQYRPARTPCTRQRQTAWAYTRFHRPRSPVEFGASTINKLLPYIHLPTSRRATPTGVRIAWPEGPPAVLQGTGRARRAGC